MGRASDPQRSKYDARGCPGFPGVSGEDRSQAASDSLSAGSSERSVSGGEERSNQRGGSDHDLTVARKLAKLSLVMQVTNIHEAKTHLSRLIDRAAAGE